MKKYGDNTAKINLWAILCRDILRCIYRNSCELMGLDDSINEKLFDGNI